MRAGAAGRCGFGYADPRGADRLPGDDRVRRGRAARRARRRTLRPSSRHQLRNDGGGPRADARRGGRRSRCRSGVGEGGGSGPGVAAGEHPRRRSVRQGSAADAAPRSRHRSARGVALVAGPAHRPDLQRRRQRAAGLGQPAVPARADRRHGHAAQRAGARPEPRPHEAGVAGGAGAGAGLPRLRPARGHRPAHDQRHAAWLPPDLRTPAAPEHAPGDRPAAARRVAARGDRCGQSERRLGFLPLRQRAACGGRRAELAHFRPPPALQQQLRRAA